MQATVIEWDGTHLPRELKELPPGQYYLAPMDAVDGDEISEEEEVAVLEGIEALEAGNVMPLEEAIREIRARAWRA